MFTATSSLIGYGVCKKLGDDFDSTATTLGLSVDTITGVALGLVGGAGILVGTAGGASSGFWIGGTVIIGTVGLNFAIGIIILCIIHRDIVKDTLQEKVLGKPAIPQLPDRHQRETTQNP